MEPVLRLPWNSTTTFVIIGAAIATAGVAALQAQVTCFCRVECRASCEGALSADFVFACRMFCCSAETEGL